MGTGAHSCLCNAAWKEGQLLGRSGLLPKVVQPSEKWDSPHFVPSPLQGEEPLLLSEIMHLPLLHTHASGRGDMCPQLFWERAFPSCHNSSRKQQTASAPSHHCNMRNTQGASRARLPPCLLPASSCSLSHVPPSIAPLQAAPAGMTMASLPHGNIHPQYPACIFLPSPRNAKAWG